jgi:hypothetical protein
MATTTIMLISCTLAHKTDTAVDVLEPGGGCSRKDEANSKRLGNS